MIELKEKSGLLEKVDGLKKFIGNTPLLPVHGLHRNKRVKVFAKLEWQQMGGSVKSRPAWSIIREAIANRKLRKGMALLDATSGNTGIAYATLGAALGIPITLCLPENASLERKRMLKALGANLVFTSPFELTEGAQRKAKELKTESGSNFFYADQYSNENNWKAHFDSTAEEIWKQTEGEISHFIAGLGTTGTFTGTSRKLRLLNDNIRKIALQPETAFHGMDGWKHLDTAGTPAIYDDHIADEMREVRTENAFEMIKKAANTIGFLLSPSSGANLAAALNLADEIDEGVIVTLFPDDSSKYGDLMNQLFN